ncbi:MAG TPA: GNAT family N-acetyltransferase [Chloroflexota bacterium]|nr:GNAT family N-acetyltransferase [Chloroflexota bacterium]
MTPATSNRLPPAALRTLDAYADDVLACPPELARRGGVHVLATARRALPAWHGYTLPIVALSFAPGAVVACRTDLANQLLAELGSDSHQPYLDGPALRRLWRAIGRCIPNAFTLAGDFRAADPATFAPSPNIDRAEHIPDDDPSALHLRTRFDGAIFGVRGPHGRLVSWAALKLKSDHVWEIAVATEADYRGRGYARDVVSAASRFTLDHDRLPIYIHDRDNGSSAFVARAVGFQLYAEIVLSEY